MCEGPAKRRSQAGGNVSDLLTQGPGALEQTLHEPLVRDLRMTSLHGHLYWLCVEARESA